MPGMYVIDLRCCLNGDGDLGAGFGGPHTHQVRDWGPEGPAVVAVGRRSTVGPTPRVAASRQGRVEASVPRCAPSRCGMCKSATHHGTVRNALPRASLRGRGFKLRTRIRGPPKAANWHRAGSSIADAPSRPTLADFPTHVHSMASHLF